MRERETLKKEKKIPCPKLLYRDSKGLFNAFAKTNPFFFFVKCFKN